MKIKQYETHVTYTYRGMWVSSIKKKRNTSTYVSYAYSLSQHPLVPALVRLNHVEVDHIASYPSVRFTRVALKLIASLVLS